MTSCHNESPESSGLQSISLGTLDGQTFSLQQPTQNKGTIFLFMQPECPFCKSYSKTFKNIDSIYRQKDIPLIGVVAGKNYPVSEIKEYTVHNQFGFKIILDPDFVLTKQLGAMMTPEVFLVDQNGETLYRGLLDDWAYEIGKVRPQVTKHYLMDACDAFLLGNKIPLDSTEAIGCYIQ